MIVHTVHVLLTNLESNWTNNASVTFRPNMIWFVLIQTANWRECRLAFITSVHITRWNFMSFDLISYKSFSFKTFWACATTEWLSDTVNIAVGFKIIFRDETLQANVSLKYFFTWVHSGLRHTVFPNIFCHFFLSANMTKFITLSKNIEIQFCSLFD